MDKKIKAIISAVLLIFALIPFLIGDYFLGILIAFLTTAYLSQCWNIMGGYSGQFSFGHAAFFGIGAYTSSLLYVDFGISPLLGMFAGIAVAGLVGLLIGFLSFRYHLRGDYFALATLAFAEILRVIFNNTTAFKAAVGVTIPFVDNPLAFQSADRKFFYFIALLMLIGITFLIYRLQQSKTGYYWVALRDDEDAAAALGVNTFRYKLLSVVLSASLSALAGTFYAQYFSYIDASLVFGAAISIQAIVPCIVGGAGTVVGPILGAVMMTALEEVTNSYLSGLNGLNMVIYGCILVLVIIFFPKGIVGLFQKNGSDRGAPFQKIRAVVKKS